MHLMWQRSRRTIEGRRCPLSCNDVLDPGCRMSLWEPHFYHLEPCLWYRAGNVGLSQSCSVQGNRTHPAHVPCDPLHGVEYLPASISQPITPAPPPVCSHHHAIAAVKVGEVDRRIARRMVHACKSCSSAVSQACGPGRSWCVTPPPSRNNPASAPISHEREYHVSP
jgi:hypothetical protein